MIVWLVWGFFVLFCFLGELLSSYLPTLLEVCSFCVVVFMVNSPTWKKEETYKKRKVLIEEAQLYFLSRSYVLYETT